MWGFSTFLIAPWHLSSSTPHTFLAFFICVFDKFNLFLDKFAIDFDELKDCLKNETEIFWK